MILENILTIEAMAMLAGFILPVHFFMMIVECVYDFIKNMKTRDWVDSITNTINFIIYSSRDLLFAVGTFIFYPLVPPVSIIFPTSIVTWVILFLAVDFIYYWTHRAEHTFHILWAQHNVHHSSNNFNLTIAFRISWFSDVIHRLAFLPLLLIGFNPLQVALSVYLVTSYQNWLHTDKIPRIPILEKIFVTPQDHKVHHALNKPYLGKNFGALFIFWDKLFGTYRREIPSNPVDYGRDRKMDHNPITYNLSYYGFMISNFRKSKTLKGKFSAIFGRVQ